MQKNEIIHNLYNSKEVNEAIQKMQPEELREDLKSEMFTALCELSDERIIKMHEAGWIKYYLVRMMLNMVKSDRSGFYKKYRRPTSEIKDIPEVIAPEFDYTEEDVSKSVEGLNWYERDLLFSYVMKGCNATKLSKEIGIPRRSIDYTISIVRRKVDTTIRKTKKMQIEIIKRIVINTTNDMDPDTIVELIEDYDRMVDRKIRECSTKDTYIHKVHPAKLDKFS